MQKVANEGEVFVCLACGKRSKDRYGEMAISRGWDVSCMLNSILCLESHVVLKNERVVKINDGGEIDEKSKNEIE